MSTASAPVITVDGPSGAGKGTLCAWLADQLNWQLLDSGALYRLTGLAAVRRDIELHNEAAVADVAASLDVRFEPTPEGVITFLDGQDVGQQIRTEEVGSFASQVAALPAVREALLQRQRDFQNAPGLVADGRDMGTVVFTSAPIKIFLTATAEERAQRRYQQLIDKGFNANLRALIEDIRARDERDSNRAVAPLRPAADAVLIDSTDMPIEQVCQQALDLVRKAGLI